MSDTLYLIVYKDIIERIFSGDKTTEYREITDYWKKRLVDKPYSRVRITNGYGNDTRPYVLLRYGGYVRKMINRKQHYAIPIMRDLWCEYRRKTGGKITKC